MDWAGKRKLRVASRGHGIVCRHSNAVLMVDFVFEELKGTKQMRRGQVNRRCYLASVYSSSAEASGRRGGGLVGRYAARYMQAVQRVCNRDMNFFPTVLAMRVYKGRSSGEACSVYARNVGIH